MFDKRSLRVLAQYFERFEERRGSGRVDVVLRSTGVDEGVTQTTVIDDTMVLIEFGDGHARFVPMEEIVQLVVWEDEQAEFGFSIGSQAPPAES